MPRPRKGEKKKDFIERYMASEEARRTFPDPDQRYAVANSLWAKSKGKKNTSQAARGRERRRKRRKRR